MNMFEGIRSGTPYCEVLSHSEVQCSHESVIRMQTECQGCGHSVLRFFCDRHCRGLKAQQVVCYHCRSSDVWVRVSLLRANELWMRCFKARLMSWINSDRVGATLPLGDGQYVVFAVYENGRYYKPEPVTVPDSLPSGWGPDGPVNFPQKPVIVDTDEDDDDDEDDEDAE